MFNFPIGFSESNQQEISNNFLVYHPNSHCTLYNADFFMIAPKILEKYPQGIFDMIFADPPYFLSNDGITCKNGEMVKVNKGKWDKSQGVLQDHTFHAQWLEMCQKLLKPHGTLWVSGTSHAIFSIGFAMQTIGYKILNDVIWEKPNPPPNLACRYFTHSHETLIWAAKNQSSKHYFNYELMKEINDNKQMKTVWKLNSVSGTEKFYGKHPTQKPLSLLKRIILASTKEDDFVFDPFAGSCTTGVASLDLKRKFCGVEQEKEFYELSVLRMNEIIRGKND